MGASSRLRALKKVKRTDAGSGELKARKFGLPRRVWIVLGVLLAGGGTLAVFEFLIWNKVPAALVGTWDVQTGSLAGGAFEFSRDGTLRMRHGKADVTWRVRVNG